MNHNDSAKAHVTVAIPAFNEEIYLEGCIKSIKQQSYKKPVEIVVINNASTDKTAAIAMDLGVKVINVSQKGLYYARQSALEKINSEILIFIDADTRLNKDWISNAINAFSTNADIVAVSSNFYFYDVNLFVKTIFFLYQAITVPLLIILLRLFGKPSFILGSSFAVKSEELKKAGGFDERFIFYGEDIALSHRIATRGKIKLMSRVFVGTSARRYKKLGLLKTIINYFGTSIYLTLGKMDKASDFSKKQRV